MQNIWRFFLSWLPFMIRSFSTIFTTLDLFQRYDWSVSLSIWSTKWSLTKLIRCHNVVSLKMIFNSQWNIETSRKNSRTFRNEKVWKTPMTLHKHKMKVKRLRLLPLYETEVQSAEIKQKKTSSKSVSWEFAPSKLWPRLFLFLFCFTWPCWFCGPVSGLLQSRRTLS